MRGIPISGKSCALLGPLLCAFAAQVSQAGSYSDAVLADNPLAYYRLNESTGSTAASIGSAAGVDATYVNIPGATATNTSALDQAGPPLPGFDASNRSVFFEPEDGPASDGSDTPLIVKAWDAIGTDPLALDGSTGLTIEAWIRRSTPTVTSGAENEGIASRYQQDGAGLGSGGRSYNLFYDNDINAIAMAVSDDGAFKSAGVLEATDFDVPVGEWLHVVGTYAPPSGPDPATMAIFVNGEEVANRTTTLNSLFSGAADFWIGQQFTTADNWTFEGNIDEVAIYDQVLSDQAILGHYQAAIPEPSSLVVLVLGVVAFGSLKIRQPQLQ